MGQSRIKELLGKYDFAPEPGRRRLGYSLADCECILAAVYRHDLKFRSQSWAWLSRVSGIPETTIRRILKDSRECPQDDLNVSLLSRAATASNYLYYTKGEKFYSHLQRRDIILSVCKEE